MVCSSVGSLGGFFNWLSVSLKFMTLHYIHTFFFPPLIYLKEWVEILTCHSSTVTFHTDSVSSSPATPECSAAAEDPDCQSVVEPEAFRSSSAVLLLPS